MGDLPTVAVKSADGSYAIINESDFDASKHERYDGPLPRDVVTDLTNRNADGTYSEPTPTDIRFPNKDLTEFANNHGSMVGKSAAQMRAEQELPDAPGGLAPDPVLADAIKETKKAEAEAAKNADKDGAAAQAKAEAAGETEKVEAKPAAAAPKK